MVGHVGWNMILSVSISFPEKQKGFVDLVVKLGVDSGGGLREVNVNFESLFSFDLDVNDRPVQLARLAAYHQHHGLLTVTTKFQWRGTRWPAFPIISAKSRRCD